jgi:signal transduction histidine kinase/CheY-like chemotaxis protein
MGKSKTADRAVPRIEVAAAYLPVVRGFLVATGCYYTLICASHPFYETGAALWVLESLAIMAAFAALFWWRHLKRAPLSMARMEIAAATTNALFIANVAGYMLIHFEPLKLVYFILMALVFGTSAPSRRVAYLSVAAATGGLILMARNAPGDLIGQYAFVGIAGTFAALGMSALMRGAVLRELGARLASDALNQKLEEKLVENDRLRLEAQAANRAKTEFLATISHEIRTPLNGVLGMAQVMEQGTLSAAQRARLGVVQSSGRALLDVVNDVLDISKIEAGRLEITPAAFDLRRFVDAMERLYGGVAGEKGLTLTVQVAPEVRGWRIGDEVRLRQVLGNLISNALKFTDAGGVAVSLGGDGEQLNFTVSDTGIGIPADAQPTIFDRFHQADGSNTRRVGGSGLGLAICKELVALMGGEIGFTSQVGTGSCFTFHLPCARTEPAARAAPEPSVEPSTGLRLLVVDDNATNRTVLKTLLEHVGADVGVAHDGLEAVAAWETGHWDVILMDIHMPDMDGLEASRAIRAQENALKRVRTPIIAVTASVLSHETASYRAAGMDDVVAKPVELEALLAALDGCLQEQAPAARAAEA